MCTLNVGNTVTHEYSSKKKKKNMVKKGHQVRWKPGSFPLETKYSHTKWDIVIEISKYE